jgi:hypothetical protein
MNKNGLIEIKPKKGKEIKKIIEERTKALDQLKTLTCINCDRFEYHAT